MTPTRLREIIGELHWSQRDLAELAECNERLTRRWASGDSPVPEKIGQWLEEHLVLHRSHPMPDWRSRSQAE